MLGKALLRFVRQVERITQASNRGWLEALGQVKRLRDIVAGQGRDGDVTRFFAAGEIEAGGEQCFADAVPSRIRTNVQVVQIHATLAMLQPRQLGKGGIALQPTPVFKNQRMQPRRCAKQITLQRGHRSLCAIAMIGGQRVDHLAKLCQIGAEDRTDHV